LWESNGSAETTRKVQDLGAVYLGGSGYGLPFTVSGAHVFFPATDRQHGSELWAIPLSALGGACVGDCSSDGTITVDELIRGVNIAIGTLPLEQCPAFDTNNDHSVSVDELLRGVNNALNGCSGL
jgi:hypothetical protein